MDYLPTFLNIIATLVGYMGCYIKQKTLRSIFIIFISLTFLFSIFYVLFTSPSWISLISLAASSFQVFNLTRAINLRYQINTSKRILINGLSISALTSVFFIFNEAVAYVDSYLMFSLTVFMIGLSGIIMIFKNTSKVTHVQKISDSDLPTVSVLIPARNEDSQLTDCIESVIESDYPKLEILVLDDCSQDNSSEIIKSFAQKGVRFIQGEMPKENWLAKNQAYETLALSASGDWYFFMGVDVRLSKKTLRTLMNEVIDKKLLMAGILPSYKNPNFIGIF
jgi:FlaA1/EpsC-like NDP-sugar epimerase